jgi:hypothetical protein
MISARQQSNNLFSFFENSPRALLETIICKELNVKELGCLVRTSNFFHKLAKPILERKGYVEALLKESAKETEQFYKNYDFPCHY